MLGFDQDLPCLLWSIRLSHSTFNLSPEKYSSHTSLCSTLVNLLYSLLHTVSSSTRSTPHSRIDTKSASSTWAKSPESTRVNSTLVILKPLSIARLYIISSQTCFGHFIYTAYKRSPHTQMTSWKYKQYEK